MKYLFLSLFLVGCVSSKNWLVVEKKDGEVVGCWKLINTQLNQNKNEISWYDHKGKLHVLTNSDYVTIENDPYVRARLLGVNYDQCSNGKY
jgi:uncharacterized protein YcfL